MARNIQMINLYVRRKKHVDAMAQVLNDLACKAAVPAQRGVVHG